MGEQCDFEAKYYPETWNAPNRKAKATKLDIRQKYTEDFTPQPAISESGWCAWVTPMHGSGDNNYRMKCCDCGLVHEVQFRVITDHRGRKSVKFRMRREQGANALTASA